MLRRIKKVEFPVLEPISDRRGIIASFIIESVPNTEYIRAAGTELLRHIYVLLNSGFSFQTMKEYSFEEFNHCWTRFEIEKDCYRLNVIHKYWSDNEIEAFKEIIRALCKLHRWELSENTLSTGTN